MNVEEKKLYGVWIYGKGWLKGSDVFADADYSKAQQVARLVGSDAVVRFIDKSIVDLEQYYLDQEIKQKGKSLWNKLMNMLPSRQRSSSSKKTIHS